MRFAPSIGARAQELLERAEREEVVSRIWGRDHTLWGDDPAEISDRLGWLDTHERTRAQVPALRSFASRAAADGLTHVVLCGMGGSSLAPEVLAHLLHASEDGLELLVLDTTHPDDILATERLIEPERTLFLISSKSGTTLETLCQLDAFWEAIPNGRHFAAVTDPGTPLEATARERDFREVFAGDPDVGGRYSALSLFGAVPAALLGVDVQGLLSGAADMASWCGPGRDLAENPGVVLGIAMAAGALEGRDKLTLHLPEPVGAFGPWVEQLVAESTGKRERGILPVAGEDLGLPEVYGADRLFVYYGSDPRLEALMNAGHPVVFVDSWRDEKFQAERLGGEFFRWEFATAVAGWGLGINPFDQPNVQEAKDATEAILADDDREDPGFDELEPLVDRMAPGDYLAIHAYLPRNDDLEHRLHAVRMRLRDRLRVATTVGFGPRFLHSTGQLHKGGPPNGVFVQVTDEPVEDRAIPGRPFTFGTLIEAQALGDLRALRSRGRRVARVHLSDLESV